MNRQLACIFFGFVVGCSNSADLGGGEGGSGESSGSGVHKPDPIPPVFAPGDCGLDEPAFCDTFEEANAGGKSGDLDETTWSFSRWGHFVTMLFDKPTALGQPAGIDQINTPTFCGEAIPKAGIDAPDDVKFCVGADAAGKTSRQVNEVLNDWGGFALNEMRIRQPFDFTDRTGTLVFDVDAKHNDKFGGNTGHGWWLELWISEDPTPLPYHGAPTIASTPRSALGIQIIPVGCGFADGTNEVSRVIITKDYEFVRDESVGGECFKTADGKLNRFRVELSKNHVDVYASDFDQNGKTRKVFSTDLDLHFTYGYVHFQHAHYNANKDAANGNGASPTQTYRWDNIGFDGPTYPTPRGYDVKDELDDAFQNDADGNAMRVGKTIGYDLAAGSKSFTLPSVDVSGALSATFNFNLLARGGGNIQYRMNGHAWHAFTVPDKFGSDTLLRAFSAEIPLDELTNGVNKLEIQNVDLDYLPLIGNMDLTVEHSGK